MHCNEGDFEDCKSAVQLQVGVSVYHEIISGLPEKVAHNKLWEAWRQNKHKFDMFVKVDADTVLSHNMVLSSFWDMMQQNPRITGIQAPLSDYFTDGFINGLNCFSPKVTFRDTGDSLFCDRQVDVDHDIVVKAQGVVEQLRPAGLHCFQSTEKQAFHFGLHRALKKQDEIIDRVHSAWQKYGDRIRAIALLGATYTKDFNDKQHFNYNDHKFDVVFSEAMIKYNELSSVV
jgi:hypothetical protein